MDHRQLMNKQPPPPTHTYTYNTPTPSYKHTVHLHMLRRNTERALAYKTAWQINAWFLNQGKKAIFLSHWDSTYYLPIAKKLSCPLIANKPTPKQHMHAHPLIKSKVVQLFMLLIMLATLVCGVWKQIWWTSGPSPSLIRLQQVSPMIDSSQVRRPSLCLLEGGQ